MSSSSPVTGTRSNIQGTAGSSSSSSRTRTPGRNLLQPPPSSSSLIKSSTHQHANFSLCLPSDYDVIVYRAQGGGNASEFIQVHTVLKSRFQSAARVSLSRCQVIQSLLIYIACLRASTIRYQTRVRRAGHGQRRDNIKTWQPRGFDIILFLFLLHSTSSSKWSTVTLSNTTCGCCNRPSPPTKCRT